VIVRPPLRALLLALLLGALCAFAVACGQERQGLISANRAADLQKTLDRIDSDVASGSCSALTDHLQALRRDVDDLPGTVDRDLRQRLREGLQNLERRAPDECGATTHTTETTPETLPETVPQTVPQTTTQTTPETTPQTTPETTPQTTPEAPPQTEPAPVPTEPAPAEPGPSGGEQAPQGATGGTP
jgi:hypothetical protein